MTNYVNSITPFSTKFTFENDKVFRWDDDSSFPPKYQYNKFFLVIIDGNESYIKPLTHKMFDHLVCCDIMFDDFPVDCKSSLPVGISMNSMFKGIPVINVVYKDPPFTDHIEEMNS